MAFTQAELVRAIEWTSTSLVLCAALGVAGAAGLSFALARLPSDHFVRRREGRRWRWPIGLLLVLAGVAMLVLPGPGILSIVVGLVVLDVPLMRRLVVAALRRPRVAATVDAARRRHGREPFVLP